MSQDVALPIGRYVVGAPKQAPFGTTGEVDSFSGATNGQQNRILSGRMPTTRYNSAIPSIRATEENNGGGVPQIVIPTTLADGEGICVGLALYIREDNAIWIGAGTIDGQIPSGFNQMDGKYIANGGSGNVWAEIKIKEETGEIISVAVESGSFTPENTNTLFYYRLGYYEYNAGSATVTNYGCGSLDVTICRNWFAISAPFYGVTINRCGCSGGGY